MQAKITILAFLFFLPLVLPAQTINTEFGKNRVQFHKDFDEWSEYESENFVAYWYGEGRNVGQAVIQIAENEYDDIQSVLEHRMNKRIEIIVYVDLTDMKQSNIGSEETFMNSTGQAKIVGNKMFVYFNGDHLDLKRQVREGIASVFINSMLFGSSLQEIVQNAVMMNLPEWFKQGLVGYCGESWNTDLDNQLRDIILKEDFKGFEKFARKNPKLAGHSMWYYISQNYGKSTVSNLVYLTRINRSVESGLLYVLGSPYENVIESWNIHFTDRYKKESKEFEQITNEPVKVKNKRKLPLNRLVISPDGNKIAYVSNEIGKAKVYVHDLETDKRKVVFKNGFRNVIQSTDYNYPILAWNPNNYQLAILYERRDKINLRLLDVNTGEHVTEPLDPQYQRINSADFVDVNTLVFSGTVWGFSDLFLYYINTRQTQRITHDFWDDLDATFVNLRDKKGILFTSNRQSTEIVPARMDTLLPTNTFDIYYYDLENKSKELVQITETPFANERRPVAMDTTWFGFLSDESGVYNRSSGYLEDYISHYERVVLLNDGDELIMHIDSSVTSLDSTLVDSIFTRPVVKTRGITHFQSNYDRNILSYHTAPKSGKYVQNLRVDGKNNFYLGTLQPESIEVPKPTKFAASQFAQERLKNRIKGELEEQINRINNNQQEENPSENEDQPKPEKPETDKIDIDNYLFQTEFDEVEKPADRLVIIEDEIIQQQPEVAKKLKNLFKEEEGAHLFRPARIIPYRLKFRTDFVTTNMDNSLLFNGLSSYAGTPDAGQGNAQSIGNDALTRSLSPAAGILMKANFKDLLEDYQIEGGVRVPTTFNGAEYFLFFDDKKNRIDKRYAYYRRNQKIAADALIGTFPRRFETNTNIALTQWSYPFNIYKSLRATGTVRTDRLTPLATDAGTLSEAITREQRLGLKMEYVFDNTIDVAINIKNGTRYKFYAEGVKRVALNLSDDPSFKFGEGFLGIVGFDARHYKRFLKYSVLAVRAAGATSFGAEKVLFHLGGVENWLDLPRNKFDNSIPLPQNTNFAYQSVAANLRGFRMNIRNGNSFALINSEIRMPVLRYLFPRTRSAFIRNFQTVGFFDAGTAWQGFSPFTKENPINTVYLPEGAVPGQVPVVLKVNYFRDPLVAGYGVGARMLLFGYMLRVDYGWGIETRVVQKPKLYFSLGMDF